MHVFWRLGIARNLAWKSGLVPASACPSVDPVSFSFEDGTMMMSHNLQWFSGAICSAYEESIASPFPAMNAENPPNTLRLAEPDPRRARMLMLCRGTLFSNPPAVSLSNPAYASASAQDGG